MTVHYSLSAAEIEACLQQFMVGIVGQGHGVYHGPGIPQHRQDLLQGAALVPSGTERSVPPEHGEPAPGRPHELDDVAHVCAPKVRAGTK